MRKFLNDFERQRPELFLRTGRSYNPRKQGTIGYRIYKTRILRGLTAAQLAERAELSPGTVSSLETGKTADLALSTLVLIAQALNCKPEDLLTNIDLKQVLTSRVKRKSRVSV